MGKKYYSQIEMLAPVINDNDIVTKKYLDDAIAGKVKAPVKVISTANIVGTYSGGDMTFAVTTQGVLTIDGIATGEGDRILLAGQTDATQNGVYTVKTAGATGVSAVLIRSVDFDSSSKIFGGVLIPITQGASNNDTIWILTTDDPIILDTSSLVFAKYGNSGMEKQSFTINCDGTATQWTFDHNFDTTDISVSFRDAATGEAVMFEWKTLNNNSIQIKSAIILSAGQSFKVLVIG